MSMSGNGKWVGYTGLQLADSSLQVNPSTSCGPLDGNLSPHSSRYPLPQNTDTSYSHINLANWELREGIHHCGCRLLEELTWHWLQREAAWTWLQFPTSTEGKKNTERQAGLVAPGEQTAHLPVWGLEAGILYSAPRRVGKMTQRH